MKIVIVGAGAIGTLLAGLLAKPLSGGKNGKDEIWLLDKIKERAELINRKGISVEASGGNWQVQVKCAFDAKEIGPADLAIVCVKSYDTKNAVLPLKPIANENFRLLSLQNGIGNIEIISEIFGSDKVIGGVTNLGATLLETGRVRHAGKGETVLGRVDGKIPVEMRYIREVFNKAGLETRISRDIKGLIWSKLVINVGINALTAICRLNNGKLMDFDGTRKIMRVAVSEAVKVAKRKKIKLIYDDPLAKVEAVCEATSANVSSMLQDILKKKRTEIDFINGVILRQGQELGIPVPVNSILFDLVKTIEASYDVKV